MSEYTPSVAVARNRYIDHYECLRNAPGARGMKYPDEEAAEFDRMIAQVRREALEAARGVIGDYLRQIGMLRMEPSTRGVRDLLYAVDALMGADRESGGSDRG